MKHKKHKKEKKENGNVKFLGVIGIFLIVSFLTVAGLNILNRGTSNNTAAGNVVANPLATTTTLPGNSGRTTTDVQIVNLYFKNGNYYPNTIKLKKDIPTRIIVDTKTVRGCMRTIVIPKLNIRKTVTEDDNVIEFTPGISGVIPFSCWMGMGTGTIIVEEDNKWNSTANFAVDAPTTTIDDSINVGSRGIGSSCGAGGSCGCGCRS
ncbi:MAG: cupredoxin domain-containing protein [Candidatus Altiarchaeota archaeon]